MLISIKIIKLLNFWYLICDITHFSLELCFKTDELSARSLHELGNSHKYY